MTRALPPHTTLSMVAAVEVIYVVAATLWIFVVLAALCVGCRVMLKVRARRRRINRLLEVARVPLQIGKRLRSLS